MRRYVDDSISASAFPKRFREELEEQEKRQAVDATTHSLWSRVYAPRSTAQVVQDLASQNVSTVRSWLDKWMANKSTHVNDAIGLLVTGGAGQGKTSTVQLVAREMKLDVLYVDCSMAFEPAEIYSRLQSAVESQSLVGGQRVVILDEVDGISSGAHVLAQGSSGPRVSGGQSFLSDLVKAFALQSPVIMLSNHVHTTRIAHLQKERRAYTYMWKLPHVSGIEDLVRCVCEAEELEMQPLAIRQLAVNSQGDIRSLLNMMQLYFGRFAHTPHAPITEADVRRIYAENAKDYYSNVMQGVNQVASGKHMSLDTKLAVLETNYAAPFVAFQNYAKLWDSVEGRAEASEFLSFSDSIPDRFKNDDPAMSEYEQILGTIAPLSGAARSSDMEYPKHFAAEQKRKEKERAVKGTIRASPSQSSASDRLHLESTLIMPYVQRALAYDKGFREDVKSFRTLLPGSVDQNELRRRLFVRVSAPDEDLEPQAVSRTDMKNRGITSEQVYLQLVRDIHYKRLETYLAKHGLTLSVVYEAIDALTVSEGIRPTVPLDKSAMKRFNEASQQHLGPKSRK